MATTPSMTDIGRGPPKAWMTRARAGSIASPRPCALARGCSILVAALASRRRDVWLRASRSPASTSPSGRSTQPAPRSRGSIHRRDMVAIGFEPASFDAVIACYSLIHVEHSVLPASLDEFTTGWCPTACSWRRSAPRKAKASGRLARRPDVLRGSRAPNEPSAAGRGRLRGGRRLDRDRPRARRGRHDVPLVARATDGGAVSNRPAPRYPPKPRRGDRLAIVSPSSGLPSQGLELPAAARR